MRSEGSGETHTVVTTKCDTAPVVESQPNGGRGQLRGEPAMVVRAAPNNCELHTIQNISEAFRLAFPDCGLPLGTSPGRRKGDTANGSTHA